MNNLSACGLSVGLADSSLAQGVPVNLHYPLLLGRADLRESGRLAQTMARSGTLFRLQ